MKELLSIRNFKAYYQTSSEEVRAVDGISLDLNEGEILGIAGESGCGKSTFSISLSCLFPPPLKYISGEIFLDGIDITKLNTQEIRKSILGPKISFIPQSSMNALNPTIRIRNFAIDIVKQHEPKTTRENIIHRVIERFESLSLPKDVLNRYPFELSGGMRQRTLVILSTIMNPEIVIADEPTSALDVSSQREVIELLKIMVKKKIMKSLIFITHELPILRQIADGIAVMYAGQIVEIGSVSDILFNAHHPYADVLMSSMIVPEKGMREKNLPSVSGTPPDLRHAIKGCRFADRCPEFKKDCREKDIEMVELTKGSFVRCIHPLRTKK